MICWKNSALDRVRKTGFKNTNPPPETSEIDWFRQWFANIVAEMKNLVHDSDQNGFTLKYLSLKSKEPSYVAFRPTSENDEDGSVRNLCYRWKGGGLSSKSLHLLKIPAPSQLKVPDSIYLLAQVTLASKIILRKNPKLDRES